MGDRENRLSTVETESEEPWGDKSKNKKKTVLVFQKTHYTSITKSWMLMETVIFWAQNEPYMYKLCGWDAVLFGIKPGGAHNYRLLVQAFSE